MTGTEIAAIATGISAIIASFGVPKIIEAWHKHKLSKDTDIIALRTELADTKQQLKELQIKLSIIIPIVVRKNADDPDVIELMKLIDKDTGIHVTPAN